MRCKGNAFFVTRKKKSDFFQLFFVFSVAMISYTTQSAC